MSYQIIDINSWARKEYFHFFDGMSHPWYNICAQLDVTALYQYCKNNNVRFFHAYLYCMQQAINQYKPMRYRLVDGEVRLYDQVFVGIAVLADDESIRFCDLPYLVEFDAFSQAATIAEQDIKQRPFELSNFISKAMRHDTVHMTVLPWIDFTNMSHARDTQCRDSVPKIALGKLVQHAEGYRMSLSIDVHHGMMDGLHVGRFIDILQGLFNQPFTAKLDR